MNTGLDIKADFQHIVAVAEIDTYFTMSYSNLNPGTVSNRLSSVIASTRSKDCLGTGNGNLSIIQED